MGYRFELQHANYIGHLINGNVITFLESVIEDEDAYNAIKCFREILVNFNSDYFVGSYYRSRQIEEFSNLLISLEKDLEYFKMEIVLNQDNETNVYDLIHKNLEYKNILSKLYKFSQFLGKSKTKALLIPGFEENELNQYMISREGMYEFVRIHPYKTCLILQMKNIPLKEDVKILNVFDGFEKALFKVNEWPGVLVWNNDSSVFIPVNNKDDIINILNIIKYENNAINLLKREDFLNSNIKRNDDEYEYILHLSDLHLGNRKVDKNKVRLLNILEDNIYSKNENIYTIITGDLMNSPSYENHSLVQSFINEICNMSNQEPIFILGNHDVDISGIINIQKKIKGIISMMSDKKIVIIDELKLFILKFNSNLGGNFAQGEITKEQLLKMGDELDKLKAIDKYKEYQVIAILHHHPIEIEEPDWMEKHWYQKIIGGIFPKTMELVDSDIFIEWITERNIKFILHGHKHIPFVNTNNHFSVISAGSSTGEIIHKDKDKTYLTFNLITFDKKKNRLDSCTTYYEEVIGSGIKHMKTVNFI